MKSINLSRCLLKVCAILGLCLTLFSFTMNRGGEGFEIYLNNRLLVQQYGNNSSAVQHVSLDQRTVSGQLTVKYWHCGRRGLDRVITIKDQNNHLLKEWHFPNSNEPTPAMNCQVNEILKLKKANVTELNLYYSSSELPKGRMLASIDLETKATAAR